MDRTYQIFTRGEGSDLRLILPALSPSFPLKTHGHLILADIPFADRGDGWHDDKEGKRVGKIEDNLNELLEAQGMIGVGHIKQARHLIVVFYSPTPGPQSIEVPAGFLKKTTIPLDSRPDPEWSYYYDNMAPTPLEIHFNRNLQLHETLAKHGDNPELPRPVDFGCNFPTAADRQSFLKEAEAQGFPLSAAGTWGGPDHPEEPMDNYWCELVKTTSIEPETIAQICLDLDLLCQKHSGEFDGWACPVTKA